ncbi:uncharacterized protein LOC126884973 [Diabrotica virgifera virgifera]|uniref:Uncharacterized protein LOC114337950 n=1 Tax=Diabrotica virgifera virgifera TaxID=50390 RepID=A0A6P7GCC7_DIAVI|nr:uncharacterized protein LOC126884973 [Diabrotica virgifera virgifera]
MKILVLLFSLAVLSAQPQITQGQSETGKFTEHDCFLITYIPPCNGTSVNDFIWRWETQSKKCVRVHSKLGCSMTKNNFRSSEDCESIAGRVCKNVVFTGTPIMLNL